MKQLEIFDIQPTAPEGHYFFRFDFGIYSRYTNSFKFEKLPPREEQEIMIGLFFTDRNPELLELREKHRLTGFELCNEKE